MRHRETEREKERQIDIKDRETGDREKVREMHRERKREI